MIDWAFDTRDAPYICEFCGGQLASCSHGYKCEECKKHHEG